MGKPSTSLNAEAWLPETALNDEVIQGWMHELVRSWAERWMGPEKAGMITISMPADPAKGSFMTSHHNALGCGLAVGADARSWLAEQCLDASPTKITSNNVDRQVLSDLVDTALIDLLSNLSEEDDVAIKETMSLEAYNNFQIRFGTENVVHLAVSYEACIALRKMITSPSKALGPLPRERHKAFGAQTIRMEAEVGHITLDVNALSDLSPGKIIPFDRSVAAGFPLLVNGAPAEGIQARFVITQAKKRARKTPGIILELTDG